MMNRFVDDEKLLRHLEERNQGIKDRWTQELKNEFANLSRNFVLLILNETYRSFFQRIPLFSTGNLLIEIHRVENLLSLIKAQFTPIEVKCEDTVENIRYKQQNAILFQTNSINYRRTYRCVLMPNREWSKVNVVLASKVIFSILCKRFYLVGVKKFKGQSFMLFSDWKEKYVGSNREQQYLIVGAIGDSLIHVPALFWLQQNNRTQDRLVSLHEKKEIAQAVSFFTRHHTQANEFLNLTSFKFIQKENSPNYHIIPLPKQPIKSAFEHINECYPIETDSQEVFRFFRQNFILPTSHRLFQFRKRFRYIIGFQRCSDSVFDGIQCKKMSIEKTREFLDLCRQHHIGVVNLEPSDKYKDIYDLDISALDLGQIYPVMTELDAFIGVDSCFGHAAALLDVPSVTVFVSSNVWYQYMGRYYMPISRNYSLFPIDHTTIKSEKLFQVVWDILTGNKKLSGEFVPYSEREEFKHYEYIE